MSKRFRVALSFAGEKRDFVAEVARMLAKRFSVDEILYDRFHEAEMARNDLAFYLPNLYHSQSDLVVTVFCKDFETNKWCGAEWNAIYSSIMKKEHTRVMLCRFDLIEGEGLYGLAGFVELDEKSPAMLATLILERLAINEGHPREYYTAAGPDWPEIAPKLDWPIADHTEAQKVFAHFITRSSRFRLLPIRGGSETGKSHLTKQFLRNALTILELTCARFDFDADPNTTMEQKLRTFALDLSVPEPSPGAGVSAQFSEIFNSLKRAQRPTLLIFDTFEHAGEAATSWVKTILLNSLVRTANSWLRIVIVGQGHRIPNKLGETWADVSAESIELSLPTPEEWFEFSRPFKPAMTLQWVQEAYGYCGGKSSLLAQFLGPT